jgi:hypothetical protein
MLNQSLQLKFTIPISVEAHQSALHFAQLHPNSEKAQQVYLNTLAVYIGQSFLEYLGFETDLDNSESCNPVMQTLMDTADIHIKNIGKLEFRSLLSQSQVVHIPLEVWEDRLGYVAVQFDESLQTGTLVGFIQTPQAENISLSEFQSIEHLLDCLEASQPVNLVQSSINLYDWLKGVFTKGWETLEHLNGSSLNLAPVLRTASEPGEGQIKRAKVYDFGVQIGKQSVTMLVNLIPKPEQKIEVRIQVCPTKGEDYLPANLQLLMLAENDAILQQVQSRDQDSYIQLKRFKCSSGDHFKIQLTFEDMSFTEEFTVEY